MEFEVEHIFEPEPIDEETIWWNTVPEVYQEIASELLLQLEFFQSEETDRWYATRPFSDTGEARGKKLMELSEKLYPVAQIMFMTWGDDLEKRERIFGDWQYEMCRNDGDKRGSEQGFELGMIWAEYKLQFGQMNWEGWEREKPNLSLLYTPELLERMEKISEQQSGFQDAGAQGNSEKGIKSKAAVTAYLSRLPKGYTEGRTSTYLANDLTVEIETYIKLKGKVAKGLTLNDHEKDKLRDKKYLEVLVNYGGKKGTRPYATRTLRSLMSESKKSGSLG